MNRFKKGDKIKLKDKYDLADVGNRPCYEVLEASYALGTVTIRDDAADSLTTNAEYFDFYTITNDEAKYVATRYNDNKPDLTYLPKIACEQEALVWEFGAKKYSRNNWKKLLGDKTYEVANASLLRHAFAIANGELIDKESGLPHAAHIRCNAAMILEYQMKTEEK